MGNVIVCPNCGSNDISLDSEVFAHCNHCDTQIALEKAKQQIIVKNEIHIDSNADGETGINIQTYTLKKEYDAVAFMRDALLLLASNKSTPEDILDANFYPQKMNFQNYAVVKQHFDFSYTASIGYDRRESYVDYVKKTKTINGQSVTTTEPETKWRNVIDWQPYNGDFSCDEQCVISFDNDEKKEAEFTKFLQDKGSENLIAIENAQTEIQVPPKLSPEQSKRALQIGQTKAETRCKSSLPGNHSKDFMSNGKRKITSISNIVVPQYELSYEYKEKNYNISSFVNKKEVQMSEYPQNDALMAKVATQTKKQGTVSAIVMASFIVVALLCLILANITGHSQFYLIALIPTFIVAGVVASLYFFKSSKVKKEGIKLAQDKKKDKIISIFKEKGLAEPTEDELKIF